MNLGRVTLAAALSVFAVLSAQAQSWPTRPIRLLVPFVAGGSSDIVARSVAVRLQESLGQTVIVDNRPGANGAIAGQLLAKASPDGYTFMVGSIGVFAINVALFKDLPYDPLRDYDLLTVAVRTPNVLVASQKVAASNVKDLVGLLQKNPGKITFVSSGTGSSDHLSAELFWQRTSTTGIHVPYKGGAAAMADMIGGQVDVSFQNLGAAAGHIKGGRLRALAITGDKRAPQFPDVPTMVELGFSGFEVYSWQAFAAPRGLPKEIRSKLEGAVIAALKSPQLRQSMDELGFDVVANTGAQFETFLKQEITRWRQVVQTANIKAD
ncbi:MAG: tripartite tricarboxylate transporter substrate binding protein [Proteobacteria bacterium]|nr:tripartite tricarboxylate transporter substrate binding protein [Burkholderiales bacterium]